MFDKNIVWNKTTSLQEGIGLRTLLGARGVVKIDAFGRPMIYEHYGRRDLNTGWEVDHIKRVRDGGTDDYSNLRPLNWRSNVERG